MSGHVPEPARPNTLRQNRDSGTEPVDIHALIWAQYPDLPSESSSRAASEGCVFAKSCNLPDGVINHNHPTGFVPVERLTDYGQWAVLGTGGAITAESTSLRWIGGSTTARALGARLGGSLGLGLLSNASLVTASATVGTVALLIPNTTLAPTARSTPTTTMRRCRWAARGCGSM
ncbi:MAG: hypothetical protein GAK37_02148 [Pseudomonas sp.]|nr:MAG: hypothetical protein GAK37_02148 [Pseudomonas sp.]